MWNLHLPSIPSFLIKDYILLEEQISVRKLATSYFYCSLTEELSIGKSTCEGSVTLC